jgi:hypothetical protein
MGLLVLKYTSYAILDHQAADVMQPVVFVFILFHNDKTSLMSDDSRMFMMSLRQQSTDMSIDVVKTSR